MANKSTDILHIERSEILRSLRLQSSYTQKQLAEKLGISREKVVAVENCHLKSMLALELDTIKKWWELSRLKSDMETQKQFARLMKKELSL